MTLSAGKGGGERMFISMLLAIYACIALTSPQLGGRRREWRKNKKPFKRHRPHPSNNPPDKPSEGETYYEYNKRCFPDGRKVSPVYQEKNDTDSMFTPEFLWEKLNEVNVSQASQQFPICLKNDTVILYPKDPVLEKAIPYWASFLKAAFKLHNATQEAKKENLTKYDRIVEKYFRPPNTSKRRGMWDYDDPFWDEQDITLENSSTTLESSASRLDELSELDLEEKEKNWRARATKIRKERKEEFRIPDTDSMEINIWNEVQRDWFSSTNSTNTEERELIREQKQKMSWGGYYDVSDSGVLNCTNLKNVHKSLHLDDCEINSIDMGSLKHLTKVTHISLRRNNISHLPRGIFSSFRELQTVILDSNRLDSIPEGVFQGLPNLTHISLSHNRIRSFADGRLRYLPEVREIHLEGNVIERLPTNLRRFFPRLEDIDLSDNEISEIPKGFLKGLNRLERFEISKNKIQNLPKGLFQSCKNLTILNLADNRIARIPEDTFRGLTHLANLDLSRNRITELRPQVFSSLNALRALIFDENALGHNLSPGIFKDLRRLGRLSMVRTNQTAISRSLFSNLRMLKVLKIYDNPLLTLDSDTFYDLGDLRKLDMHGHLMHFLPTNLLAKTTLLVHLHIKGPNLNTIPFALTDTLQDVRRSDLDKLTATDVRLNFKYNPNNYVSTQHQRGRGGTGRGRGGGGREGEGEGEMTLAPKGEII
ncbi:hypothetical protein AAMO2058_001391800 [Amorphochlora amoebiformis]